MDRQLQMDPARDARAIADNVEQVALEVRRTVNAVMAIVDDGQILYKRIRPLVEWLKPEPTAPKLQVVVSPAAVRQGSPRRPAPTTRNGTTRPGS